ncbi:MAG: FGGY family carbohydrate kinase [Lachnospiraceae bacterium]
MQNYIMALDQGTTSSRCILFDRQGNICSMAQMEFTQIFPKPGWVEHDPMEIWSSQIAVAAKAMGKIGVTEKNIAAIGITNQRETTIVWEKSNRKAGIQCDRLAVPQDCRKSGGTGKRRIW